jgi:hypothetical protein
MFLTEQRRERENTEAVWQRTKSRELFSGVPCQQAKIQRIGFPDN